MQYSRASEGLAQECLMKRRFAADDLAYLHIAAPLRSSDSRCEARACGRAAFRVCVSDARGDKQNRDSAEEIIWKF